MQFSVLSLLLWLFCENELGKNEVLLILIDFTLYWKNHYLCSGFGNKL